MRRYLLLLILILFALFLWTGNVLAVKPGDFGLKEGNLIRAVSTGDPDIFIINELGYKRIFLSPAIFSFYGHLGGYSQVKPVTTSIRDIFKTSNYYRNCETNDTKVYQLEVTGEDTGILHWLNMSGSQTAIQDSEFFSKIFCINNREFAWYNKGSEYKSLGSISSQSDIKVDLKINETNNPGQIAWNEKIIASWTSSGAVRCAGFEHMNTVDSSSNTDQLATSGEIYLYNSINYSQVETIVAHIVCYNKDNNFGEDFVEIPLAISTKPSISISSISNDSVTQGANLTIKWSSSGISPNVNIILTKSNPNSVYKSDYWYIAKNMPNSGSYVWPVGNIIEPVSKWKTTSTSINPGSYGIIIFNDTETLFAVSKEFSIK